MSSSQNLCVAKVLVADSEGNILLLRRSETHPYYAHHWDFPGGEVEKNEKPKVAALRELQEEAGITLEASHMSIAFEKQTLDNTTHALFAATLDDLAPPVTISWEHDRYVWLSVENILKLTMPEHADSYYIDVIEWLADTKTAS